jgi:hypothetical protein
VRAVVDTNIAGDEDLHVLRSFAGIPIITVAEALKRLESS